MKMNTDYVWQTYSISKTYLIRICVMNISVKYPRTNVYYLLTGGYQFKSIKNIGTVIMITKCVYYMVNFIIMYFESYENTYYCI